MCESSFCFRPPLFHQSLPYKRKYHGCKARQVRIRETSLSVCNPAMMPMINTGIRIRGCLPNGKATFRNLNKVVEIKDIKHSLSYKLQKMLSQKNFGSKKIGGHFGFWRRCGVAGGERVPPAPLGWYCSCFSGYSWSTFDTSELTNYFEMACIWPKMIIIQV